MTVESWAVGEVQAVLNRAGDAGEGLGFEALREEVGIGHDDLEDVLNHLRERGDAVESAPGEWRSPYEDEREGAAIPPAAESTQEGEPPPPPAKTPGTENVGRRAAPVPDDDESQIALTAKVLAAMDSETIGKIVEAGVAEAQADHKVFVLRVGP